MSFFVQLSKKKRLSGAVRNNRLLKSLSKSVYKALTFPFTRNGVKVSIGGAGIYRLDHNFTFSRYDEFGDKHNSGFKNWIDCCKGKAAVFDIGAHIGLYALPASSVVAPGGTVYAFEPAEANRMYLGRHLRYNNIRNVEILPYLAGETSKDGQIFFESRRSDPMNSVNPKKKRNVYRQVLRRQISLDDFSAQYGIGPEVIKIDVEGAEYGVLAGAAGIIDKYKPVIFLSVHPDQLMLFESSAERLMDMVKGLNYTARDYSGKTVSRFEFGEYVLSAQ